MTEMTGSSEEPSALIIPISETQAVVLDARDDGQDLTPAGQKLTASEVSRLANAMKSASDAYITAKRATGHLVEIDPQTRALLKTGTLITESGGWTQANVRNSAGHVVRIMRVRPASGVALLNPAAAVLGSVAAQAQTAEMAQDIQDILSRITQLQQSFANDRHGQVMAVVNEISHHVLIAREHGETEISDAAISTLRLKASHLFEANLLDLKSAVQAMTSTKRRLPSGARKDLSEESIVNVQTSLDHAALLFASSAQLYALETSRLLAQGKPQVARTHLDELAEWRDQATVQLQQQLDALADLDQRTRALAKPFWRRALLLPSSVPSAAAGIGTAARALPIAAGRVLPVASAVGMVAGTAHAGRELLAQRTVDRHLDVLGTATEHSSDSMQNVFAIISALDESTRAIASESSSSDSPASD